MPILFASALQAKDAMAYKRISKGKLDEDSLTTKLNMLFIDSAHSRSIPLTATQNVFNTAISWNDSLSQINSLSFKDLALRTFKLSVKRTDKKNVRTRHKTILTGKEFRAFITQNSLMIEKQYLRKLMLFLKWQANLI